MKAIAIQQPFASFIAMGLINVWSMPFATDYRGRVLIVASDKGLSKEEAHQLPQTWLHILYNHDMMHNMDDLFFNGYDDIVSYPLCCVVGYANIVDCSDKAEDFEYCTWYRGGTAWRFANPHYCKFDDLPVTAISHRFFDVSGIDGRTTRHFVPGKPFYPFFKDGNLYVQQSIDAHYDENIEDNTNHTTTIWFYADDPFMQLALTGEVEGTELLPCKYVCYAAEQSKFYTRKKLLRASIEKDSRGDLCFMLKLDSSAHDRVPIANVIKPIFTDYVQDDYAVDDRGLEFSLDHKTLYRTVLFVGDYVVPDGVEFIEFEAFAFCDGLLSITIPDSVRRIGYHAFQCCKDLKTVRLGRGIEEIELFAFWGCDNLKEIIIPKGMREHFMQFESIEEVKHLIKEK